MQWATLNKTCIIFMLSFVPQRHQRWKHSCYAERCPEADRLWLRQAPLHGMQYRSTPCVLPSNALSESVRPHVWRASLCWSVSAFAKKYSFLVLAHNPNNMFEKNGCLLLSFVCYLFFCRLYEQLLGVRFAEETRDRCNSWVGKWCNFVAIK